MERERLVEDACLPCPVAHVSSARFFRLAPARLPFSIRLASPWLPQPIASFFDKHVSAGCDEIAEATPATTTTRERGRRRAAGDEGSRGRGRGGARRKATGTLLENGNATTKQTHCTTRKRKCNPCSLLTHGYNALVPPGLVSRPARSKSKQQPGRRARAALVLRAKAAAASPSDSAPVVVARSASARGRAPRRHDRSMRAARRARALLQCSLPWDRASDGTGARGCRRRQPYTRRRWAGMGWPRGAHLAGTNHPPDHHLSLRRLRFALLFFLFFPVCRSLSPISLSSVSTVPRSPRANACFALGSRAASEPVRKTSASLARHRLRLQQSSTDSSTRNGTFVTVLL